MTYKTLDDFNFENKRVLLRADLNVPRQDGKISNTERIDRVKETITDLVKAKAKIIILSHFGRPDGEHNPQMSLAFLTSILEERWGHPVRFAQDCIGEKAHAAVEKLGTGEILLLENVRFHKGEKQNDPTFIAALAELGDIYVNDAFSAAHRAHASTTGLASALPACAGRLMEQELSALDQALGNPEPPVAALIGGSKISTKLNVLNNLIEKVDFLILGGAMANTFLYAQDADVGASMCEQDMKDEALSIMEKAQSKNCEIVLPIDVVTVSEIHANAESQVTAADAIPEGRMAIDIGPKSIAHIRTILDDAQTLVWNGPMGVFEIKPFDKGTSAVAHAAATLTRSGALKTIAGGGDTVSALENAGVTQDFTYISTAGGAFLEWLEGQTLPGVQALLENNAQGLRKSA